jgi:hypothetical protein
MSTKNNRDVRYFLRDSDECWAKWMMDVKATMKREHGIEHLNIRNQLQIETQTAIRIGQNAEMNECEAIGFYIPSESILRSDLVVVF